MKKNKKNKLIILAIILVTIIGIFLYFLLRDKNKLTIGEKEWISNNSKSVINLSVANNLNNFGLDGEGVFFEFINDFGTKYKLTINPVAVNYGSAATGIVLGAKQSVGDLDYVLYKDHYVLISTNNSIVTDVSSLGTSQVAVLSKDQNYIKSYLPEITTISYDLNTVLMDDLKGNPSISYALVPLNMFIDQILERNYYIVYHFSDIPMYYTLSFVQDDTLTSILTKFSNMWMNEKFDKYYNEYNLKTFMKSLNITEKDKDILTNKIYNYGLVTSVPFETIMSGNYGGITSIYLSKFTDFSGVEFKYINYKDKSDLLEAANNKKIDIYFDYYSLNTSFEDISVPLNVDLAIIARTSNNLVVNRLESLRGKKVYVEENSRIYFYLKSLNYIDLEIYKDNDDIESLNDEDVIIALERPTYLFYKTNGFEDFSLRYHKVTSSSHGFRINGDATFYKLFNKYIESIDPNSLTYEGVASYINISNSGSFLAGIATYALIIIIIGTIIVVFYIKSKKKIKINKKIRKEDKMRFIDQLTSLKNRNYLKENIDGWNNNTIYPQAAVVVDLNNVKYINDTFGTNEGDKQIISASNILIKTQIDNTDIIRTDGNEFLIYMIGFEEKRVISYMRKLYKELGALPYEFGAAIGYSMRTDDLKTIDDAINEATLDMRTKKEKKEDKI